MIPKFLIQKENEEKIFSEISFPSFQELNKFWDSKKVIKIYEKKNIDGLGNIFTDEILYQTAQSFYVWIEKSKEDERWGMNIYYKTEQEKELILFTKNLLKQLK